MKKIVVLFSGNGTNLENIAKKLHKKHLLITKAITNNPHAKGIERAKRLGIEVEIIDHKKFTSREEFDKALIEVIKKEAPNLIVLAGFMRILTPLFIKTFPTTINIHPSLLPLFKGANALERSFKSPMKVAGVTVHWVEEELDGGEIIDQACLYKKGLKFEEFKEKIHELEYELYPKVILEILQKE
ncbi:MAG: phosphoribosylglycinamide formyltransferase [Epsilonproteobacteria bacterium]|nr:phosphoribosylglycinamide formyltransferase [Campylobacterota bacterium]